MLRTCISARLLPLILVLVITNGALGASVQLTVEVRDPDGVPIHGAGVAVYLNYTEAPLTEVAQSTDEAGRVRIPLDLPDQPVVHAIVVVDIGVREGEQPVAALRRWTALAQEIQFPVLGVPFEVRDGEREVSVEIIAHRALRITGRTVPVTGPLGATVSPVSSRPFYGRARTDEGGRFAMAVAPGAPLVIAMTNDWGMIFEPSIEAGADGGDVGVIDFNIPMGRITGHVLVDGEPAPQTMMQIMRTDGVVWSILFTNGDGRLDRDNEAPGPDPEGADEGIQLPAGEYVVLAFGSEFEGPLGVDKLAIWRALTQGAAKAELDSLPRFVIPADQRGVATIDIEGLTKKTIALIDAALGFPAVQGPPPSDAP
ncbi:MAG: hypothetical protein ACF8QF_11945 [Phycisphaerales bacterium]